MDGRPNNCFFCGRDVSMEPEKLFLLEHILCSHCEQKLVNISMNDGSYLLFKEKIKKIWFG